MGCLKTLLIDEFTIGLVKIEFSHNAPSYILDLCRESRDQIGFFLVPWNSKKERIFGF
jgi:hypothetical protein